MSSQQNNTLTGRGEWLRLESEGAVAWGRIVAMGRAEAAPMRRLIQATRPSHIIMLTGGHKRKTVLLLDSGHLVISSLTAAEIFEEMNKYREKIVTIGLKKEG